MDSRNTATTAPSAISEKKIDIMIKFSFVSDIVVRI